MCALSLLLLEQINFSMGSRLTQSVYSPSCRCGYALEHEIKAMAKAAANLSHVRTGSGKSRT